MNKNYTSIEQSKKLAEFLPLESADMNYCNMCLKGVMYADLFKAGLSSYEDATKRNQENINFYLNGTDYKGVIAWEVLPCWSLTALLDVLPKQIGRHTKTLYWFDDAWHCEYVDEDSEGKYGVTADNPVDACVAIIEKLHELKML